MTKLFKQYDLEERTAKFAERIIDQLIGSSGSIGANYCEANEAESRQDFKHKVSICKKEVKETKHWLRLLAVANPELKDKLREVYRENQELLLIFSKIVSSSRKKVVN